MHITKHRPMAKNTRAHDRLAAARARFAAADAALAPHQAELRELAAQLTDLRTKLAAAEESVASIDDARDVAELEVQLRTIEKLTAIKNAALLPPAGALYHLVHDRDGAMVAMRHCEGDLTRQQKRLTGAIDELASVLAELYGLTGDKDYLSFTLEVKV